MFQLVGYGDHAGSGLPKIYRNWAGQHWRRPVLYEQREPEQTLMELRMSSLVPEDVLVDLEVRLGERFGGLPELARLALITASAEGVLNHARLREISAEHPADITKMLASLVRDGLLAPKGTGRGMVYFLPWQNQTASMVFDPENSLAPAAGVALTPELGALTPELEALTPELDALTPELDALTPEQSGKSDPEPNDPIVISDLSQIPPDELERLRVLAEPVTGRKRARLELVQQTVLTLCRGRYLGVRVLAHLLARNLDGDDLRKRILNPLVASKALQRAYSNPNAPRQAYTTRAASTTGTQN